MKTVAIIGAGITGLTTAFYLKRAGIPVTVYEAGGRAGGVIQSIRKDGFLAEFGPNTILETSPKISQLVRDLNLESRRLDTSPNAEARFVVRGGRPMAMPSSQLGIFTSKLLSAKAKLALVREPFISARRDGKEESVAEFVTRRLNREFLDRMVDALVAGIYAGDPHKLSVKYALPKLFELEQKYGSLIKGQFFGARERKKAGEVAKDRAPKFSFDEGLQVLPDALAAQLGDSLKLNTPVTKLMQTSDGWRVTFSEGRVPRVPNQKDGDSQRSSLRNQETEFGAVIYCGTAYKLAQLNLETKKPVDLSAFSEISYPAVASVVLGFRREDVTHSCEGFGMLIPKIEGFKILGTIFSSALFPNRTPAGHILLASYIGGARYPELTTESPEELIAIVQNDLKILLGVCGKPVFQNVALYPKAIPQYNVGYGKFKDLMDEIETKARGLFFAGHFRDGVSLGDSIVSGFNIAERARKLFQPQIFTDETQID